jgi:serine/threonine protein kinase
MDKVPDPFPGEYRFLKVLGAGTYGKVWLAEDVALQSQVAIKTLRVSGPGEHAAQALRALERDARALARVRHPNIVQVHAWRQAGGESFLVMQYVYGGALADWLQHGPFDWQQAARYVADVGEGLLEVHACGIVHRDIKPANILWDPDRDEALLTDFGVSGRLAYGGGTVAGSPSYMAPEAHDGHSSPASDVFSLAATLFRLTTTELPFPGSTRAELLGAVARGLPSPDPRCRCLPEALEQVIRSGLAPSAEQRPALRDFVQRLRGSLNQSLADALAPAPAEPTPAPVELRLMVSRLEGTNYREVAMTHPRPGGLTRDFKKVPKQPEQVHMHSGDRARIEVLASQDGYVTVFNVGPSGNLNLL